MEIQRLETTSAELLYSEKKVILLEEEEKVYAIRVGPSIRLFFTVEHEEQEETIILLDVVLLREPVQSNDITPPEARRRPEGPYHKDDNKISQIKQSSDWRQIATGVIIGVLVGSLLGAGATFFSQGKEIAALKEQINQLRSQNVNTVSNPSNGQPVEVKANPEKIIEIIKEQQRLYVKESSGELAAQSFTERDLQEFRERNITKQITDNLRRNGDFLEVVLAIKQMTPGEQQRLFDQASRTYKPTWTELGKISREGQTGAGQQAERMVADAIVALARELARLPPEAIKKLSSE